MRSRLKLIVSYDGGSFSGWQSQTNRNTIQDRLEGAFERICSQPIRVHGAGRTDAGVHALAQVAHADLPDPRYTGDRWATALNANLPSSIRVMRCRFVPDTFHARFSAKRKNYRYRIWNASVLPPFEYGRAWHIATPLDLKKMATAAKEFRGQHDFLSFSANRGKPEVNTVRMIHAVRIRQAGACISIEFEGDGFLYKMARMMVGPIVRIGIGKLSEREIKTRLQQPRTHVPRARIVAPAEGLFLVRVRY
jgi:tRNA pseudouridine38-40 synthase